MKEYLEPAKEGRAETYTCATSPENNAPGEVVLLKMLFLPEEAWSSCADR